jgi:hypothetical protein
VGRDTGYRPGPWTVASGGPGSWIRNTGQDTFAWNWIGFQQVRMEDRNQGPRKGGLTQQGIEARLAAFDQ